MNKYSERENKKLWGLSREERLLSNLRSWKCSKKNYTLAKMILFPKTDAEFQCGDQVWRWRNSNETYHYHFNLRVISSTSCATQMNIHPVSISIRNIEESITKHWLNYAIGRMYSRKKETNILKDIRQLFGAVYRSKWCKFANFDHIWREKMYWI